MLISSALCVLLASCTPTPAETPQSVHMNGFYKERPTIKRPIQRNVATPAEASPMDMKPSTPEENKIRLQDIQNKLDDTDRDLNDTTAKLRNFRQPRREN